MKRRTSAARQSLVLSSVCLSLLFLLQFDCYLVMAASTLRLSGQRVLVTGAGRGIGRAIALICQEEGAQVAITSRTPSELEETLALAQQQQVCSKDDSSQQDAKNINKHIIQSYTADVTNRQQVESMVESIVQTWGGLDILINNAGRGQAKKGTLETLEADEFQNLLVLNVVGVHIVTSAVLRQSMLKSGKGKIINISSRAGKLGLPQMSQYVASKFAVEGLTASLAAELKDSQIQVNSLSPGMVNTKSFPKPEGRKGVRTAESVKDGLMAFLMDDNVTGHYLHVDELDAARAKGLDDRNAMKPINEPTFDP